MVDGFRYIMPRTKRVRTLFFLITPFMVLFVLYAALPFATRDARKYVSPDETANAYVAERLAHGRSIATDVTELSGGNILQLHPRSMGLTPDGKLVPLSFIGFPLLSGVLGFLAFDGVVPYVTPFLAAAAVVCFYFGVRTLFTHRVALLSVVLLSITPAFWYYSARSMMHNIPFVSFCVFAFTGIAVGIERQKRWLVLAGFISAGGALAIRTSELGWMLPLVLVGLFSVAKRFSWKHVFWCCVAFVLPIVIVLLITYVIVGSGVTSTAASQTEVASQARYAVSYILFPFGINGARSLQQAWNYLVLFVPVFGILFLGGVLFGALRIVKERTWTRQSAYWVAFLFMTLWLVVYYGSWLFQEGNDPTQRILGSSYLRYWLPIFVFCLPLVAQFLVVVYEKLRYGKVLVLFLLFLFVFTASTHVLLDEEYGLLALQRDAVHYRATVQTAQNTIGETAILVTGKSDKIFFPEYNVLYAQPDTEESWQQLLSVQTATPVYLVVNVLEPSTDYRSAFEQYGTTRNVTQLDSILQLYAFEPK